MVLARLAGPCRRITTSAVRRSAHDHGGYPGFVSNSLCKIISNHYNIVIIKWYNKVDCRSLVGRYPKQINNQQNRFGCQIFRNQGGQLVMCIIAVTLSLSSLYNTLRATNPFLMYTKVALNVCVIIKEVGYKKRANLFFEIHIYIGKVE